MKDDEKMLKIMATSLDGVITSKQITAAGLHRSILQKYVLDGKLFQFGRGLYTKTDVWEDDFYLLQRKYERGIYSHNTALYLLGYSDRTPAKYTLTFPKGYHSSALEKENVLIKRVVKDNYLFGIIEVKSPCGNLIRIYDLERTLCDILRGNDFDIQIINFAMKKYAYSKEKNIHKLMKYSELLHVKQKVLRYMEVLL